MLRSQLRSFTCTDCEKLDATITELKKQNQELLEKNAELKDGMSKPNKVKFFSEGKYTDDLRVCIMELLTLNVGILKIEPVLLSVFKLLQISFDKLPKRTTINEILIESRSVAQTQLAEILTTPELSNNTLHSDATTKYGHKYQTFQVNTQDGPLTLGLQVSYCTQCSVVKFMQASTCIIVVYSADSVYIAAHSPWNAGMHQYNTLRPAFQTCNIIHN